MASASQPPMENPYNTSLFQTLCHLFILFLSLPLSAMAAQGSTLEITRGPENITVATESEAALHCEVLGFPIPTVHWFKNNKLVQNNHHRRLHNSGQILFFKNVSEEDEGFYFCEAKNEKEMLRSQMAFLLPAVMELNFILQPSNVTVLREDSVTLTCRPPRSKPPAQVSWFKNNRLINPMPHISLQPNGDLLFHRVLEKDRGIYFCRASNSHLFRAVSSRKVYMNVLGPPSLEVWPAMVTAPLGSEVRFQCKVSGNPPPSITWSKQGWTVLTGGKVTIGARNASLFLSSVKSYDEGLYTCEASNVLGRAQGTASLHMAAEADPEDLKAGGEGEVLSGNKRTEQKRQEQHLIGALESSIDISPVTKLLLGYSTAASSESVALKGSLGKENRVPPAAQNLLLVMESRPFLLPSLDAVWTPTGLGDSLKNLEEFVLETEKALVTEAFYVPQQTQIKASQSSLDAVMPTLSANTETSTTQLVTGSQYLSPDHYFSPSNFHLSPSDNNEFYPHTHYSASGETPTFIYQSQALFPEPQSQPPDCHSQPPSHHSQLHSVSISGGDWVPISTADEQNKSQPTFPARNNELHPTNCPKSNMSQPLLTNSDGTKSERPKSWLAALEKHDIPIVVGVGVSLIFIFITMAFYSLVQKNEPAPTGRPAQRTLRGHSGHPQTRRTYENRAFESDAVAVTEQNTSTGSTVLLPSSNSVTMMMEPSSESLPKISELTEDHTTAAEPDPESKKHPQDHCAGLESGECQDAHNSEPWGIQASQEEGIHTFLTLQTTEPCGTPNHHSVSISHRSAPFLLSHCVSLGVTTVAVDVHYYPSSSDSSAFMPSTAQVNKGSQLPQSQEYDQTVPKLHYAQRTCL